MNELPYIDKWIFGTLTADPTLSAITALRAYADIAPAGTAMPYWIYSHQAGRDVPGNAAVRLMTRPLYQIKLIYAGGRTNAIVSAAGRADDLLTASNIVFEGLTISARREATLSYTQPGADNEERIRHLGGLYRIDCQKL